MPKIIIDSASINKNEKLALIKAFRMTNKRAGEVKKEGPEGNDSYLQYCAQLRDLSEKAEDIGFHIWVNVNGQTGHTYDKDYRETPEEFHNYETHLESVRIMLEEAKLSASSEDEENVA